MSDQILDEYQLALLAASNPDYFLSEMWCADGANSIDYIIPPVTTADPKTASLSTGAPPLQQVKPINGGAEFPRPEYNGILRLISNIVTFLNKGSEFTFDVNNTAGYSTNSVLFNYASKRYVISLHDANTANFVTNPTLINGTDWQYLDVYLPYSATLIAGIIQLATQTEVNTGTNTSKAVVPSTLQAKITANGVGIIASGSNANGWWRKYADGWIDQGGNISINAAFGVVVTLPIPFTSIIRTIGVCPVFTSSAQPYNSIGVSPQGLTQALIVNTDQTKQQSCYFSLGGY